MRRSGISKPPASAPIEPQDPQRRGRGRDGQHIAETEGKTQVGAIHEEASTVRSGSHCEQRLWPDKPFAQAVTTPAAVVRLPCWYGVRSVSGGSISLRIPISTR